MWGISDSEFLKLVAIASGAYLLAALALACVRIGPHQLSPAAKSPDVDGLAMLAGGSVCLLTSAVARLHAAAALRVEHGKLVANDASHALTSEVERELIRALRRTPGISADDLRDQLANSPATQQLAAALAADGLMRAPWRTAALRWLRWLAWGLVAISAVRVVWASDAPPDGPLPPAATWLLMLVGAFSALLPLSASRAGLGITRAARSLLERERERHRELQSQADPGDELPLAVALFGSEPLRKAAPDLAAAWGIVSAEELARQASLLA